MTLVKADGTTLAKSPGGTVLEAQAEADPKVKVLINVYRDSPYDGTNYPTTEKQLAFRAGQIIPTSVWNAEFTAPTITKVSPATGTAAGGTSVSITGRGFGKDAAPKFGATAATNIVVVNSGLITCKTPAVSAGVVDVTVTTSGGTATLTGGYTFT